MSDEKKHRHPEPDFNAILDRVEAMMKSGSLEELPMAPSGSGDLAADVARIATEQEAMGGFEHLEDTIAKQMKLDPGAAERIHGKKTPKVHIETFGCQMT